MNDNLDSRIFTNTYTTGIGRQNYLRIDELEDPLFTSFTLDIDFVSSPLFYTINYSNYGYPNVEGMSESIETALKHMYSNDISIDEGYDILPLLSASILDGNKLGFGLQQNVYIDMPLYGATEYIYMVDKRNGGADQNDAKFDSNRFIEFGCNPNVLNGYKLGDSVKTIVNDSDKAWAERMKEQSNEQIVVCDDILNNEDVKNDHKKNEDEMNAAMLEYNRNNKVTIDGKEYNESELKNKISEYENKDGSFEQFKKQIVDWANSEIAKYSVVVSRERTNNKCISKISSYTDFSTCSDEQREVYKNELKKLYGENFVKDYIYGDDTTYLKRIINAYDELGTFLNLKVGEERANIIGDKVLNKFGDKLKHFGLLNESDKIIVVANGGINDLFKNLFDALPFFVDRKNDIKKGKDLLLFKCDIDVSFSDFKSKNTQENDAVLSKYKDELNKLRTKLYGDENGIPCEMSNASKDSLYGKYLEAKEKYENDEYSQAEKTKSLAKSGNSAMTNLISMDERSQDVMDKNSENAIQNSAQPMEVSRQNSIVTSQTVLDMLGFISGMRKLVFDYPYIIQGVTGLDTAYNKHYGIKDPYLGSGDDKITLTCLESLDLRVSSMFNRYFNAVYDRQYRRERVPVNLRRFNCSIYVHDVRNFVSRSRFNENGKRSVTYNRILELTDMYYSVIEFRFFDCEIVPEETGNIFNDISNEAPSEMKKTNFTFTYGNCVVNFVPPSEVAEHNLKNQ